jgi:tetratricopeptide (TPR) repeat protein
MKKKTIILLVIIALNSIGALHAQKLIKKMSSDACDCISDLKEDGGGDPNAFMEKCFELAFAKYEKELRKEYGDAFYDSPTEEAIYNLGVEIGKYLVSDCPNFLDMIVEQEKESDSNAAALYEKGEKFYDEGNYTLAINEYDKAIRMDPENHEYLNSRGVAYYDQGKYYYAMSDFINAIRCKSNFALAYFNLAYSKYNLDDNRAALEDVETSILYDPEYCGAYNLMGLIYTDMESSDSAMMAFENAFQCDSSNSLYLFNMGYLRYSDREYLLAIEQFTKALKKGYDDMNIYSYIGNSYDAAGYYDEAIEAHSKYIEAYETDYVGFYNRGLAHYNNENYASAIEDFEKAAIVDDRDSDIFLKLGQCHDNSGAAEEARRFYDKAIEIDPDNAAYYDARAALSAKNGNYEQAISDSRKSLQLYPNDCHVYMSMSGWYKAMGDTENADSARKTGLEMGCVESE